MANSRAKGAKWERDLAKMLYLELGISFSRNLEQYRTAEGGDLIPDDESFPFSIEAKHYATGRGCKKNGGRNQKRQQSLLAKCHALSTSMTATRHGQSSAWSLSQRCMAAKTMGNNWWNFQSKGSAI